MARYQIMYWKEIPSQVRAEDADGMVKAMLPDRFQQAIDAAAMVDGSTDTDDYLAGWGWADWQEQEGSGQALLETIIGQLDADYPQKRLQEIIRAGKS